MTKSKNTQESLNKTNYKELARKALDQYMQNGQLTDGMFWAQIIALYEEDLKELADRIIHDASRLGPEPFRFKVTR